MYMKLVETKCPNCNSSIEVENNRKKIECKYCGTKFLLDDNTIKVKHISAGGISDEQEFINAETNLNKFKNYDEAYKLYLSLSKRFVDNSEIWIGLLRSITHDFTFKLNSEDFKFKYNTYWKNYCSLVEEKESNEYFGQFNNYVQNVKAINPDGSIPIVGSNSSKDIVMLLVTIFLGMYGVHKFIRGEIGKGFLYLFTAGLFGFGWIVDSVKEICYFVSNK